MSGSTSSLSDGASDGVSDLDGGQENGDVINGEDGHPEGKPLY